MQGVDAFLQCRNVDVGSSVWNCDCAASDVDGAGRFNFASGNGDFFGGGIGVDGDFGSFGGADAGFIRNINPSCQRVAQTCGASACNQRYGVPAEGCLENGVALVAEVGAVDNPMEVLEVGQGSVVCCVEKFCKVVQMQYVEVLIFWIFDIPSAPLGMVDVCTESNTVVGSESSIYSYLKNPSGALNVMSLLLVTT